MTNISLQDMAAAAVHFGHPTHKWNPKMKPYIYDKKYGIHIFDLQKTAQKLLEALEFLASSKRQNKEVLLVGTKQQARKLLQGIQEATDMPIVTDKWIPGLLTNWKTIKQRIDYFKDLKRQHSSGELEKYTKKEQFKLMKKIQDLSVSLSGVEDMRGTPDVLFVTDVLRDQIAVKEANRLKIPVVGIVDTNASPEGVDYVIPANDDALKSLTYVLDLVKVALQAKKEVA